ncbi:MAG: YczE/YyaS/YitT family protein [Ilumatobacteraceae bacterium]
MTVHEDAPPMRSVGFRLVALVASVLVVGFGIALMVSAELGVAPADVLSTGGAERLDIGVGTMGWISGAVFTVLAWVLGRPPQWGTIGGTVLVGFAVNVSLSLVPEPQALAWRVPMLIVGLALIYLSISVGVSTMLGTGPIELLMLALSDRGVSVQVSRWGIEALVFAGGVALGGQIGVGTLVFVLATGPVLARTMPPFVKFMGTTVLDRPTGLDA